MTRYAIGDIQGCMETTRRLLERLDFRPGRDRLLLTGDLVNRGPRSLEVLRWAASLGDDLGTVLGNHDLHLLAVAAGLSPRRPEDTLDEVLAAPDRDELLDWLARRPLLHREDDLLLVHAGLHPAWTAEDALALAAPIAAGLADPHARGEVLADIVRRPSGGGRPAPLPPWDPDLAEPLRTAVVVGLLTRLRTCTADGLPCATFHGPLEEAPRGVLPWFDVPGRKSRRTFVIFGHWAALGLLLREDVAGLDTGCVWRGELTALRLPERSIVQQPAVEKNLPRPK